MTRAWVLALVLGTGCGPLPTHPGPVPPNTDIDLPRLNPQVNTGGAACVDGTWLEAVVLTIDVMDAGARGIRKFDRAVWYDKQAGCLPAIGTNHEAEFKWVRGEERLAPHAGGLAPLMWRWEPTQTCGRAYLVVSADLPATPWLTRYDYLVFNLKVDFGRDCP